MLDSAGLTLLGGLDVPDSGCSCGCEEPYGGTCLVSATLYQNGNCSGGSATVPSGCYDFSNAWRIGGVETGQAEVSSQGECEETVTGTPDAPSFTRAADLCVAATFGAGCATDEVCVPKPDTSLESAACVHQSGEADCPPAFPTKYVYYESFEDDRTCTSAGCSCDPAEGETCEVQVALYDNDSCTDPPSGAYDVDGSCHATGFDYWDMGSAQFVGTIWGGSCPVSGVASVEGNAEPTETQTICCVDP